jgi:hypothetical protein
MMLRLVSSVTVAGRTLVGEVESVGKEGSNESQASSFKGKRHGDVQLLSYTI